MFQSVVVCSSVLWCVAVCCGVLRCVAVCCGVLQCAALCCIVLQYCHQVRSIMMSVQTRCYIYMYICIHVNIYPVVHAIELQAQHAGLAGMCVCVFMCKYVSVHSCMYKCILIY